MGIDELEKPRDYLFEIEEKGEKEAKNNDISSWLKNTRSKFTDKSDLSGLIQKLKDLLNQNGADPDGEKSPYCNLFIAYAYSWSDEPIRAESHARVSELEFQCRGKHLQAAISGWLLGLILCKNGKPEHAQEKIKALDMIFSKWNKEAWEFGHYDDDYMCLRKKIYSSNDWIKANSAKFEQEKEKNNKDRLDSNKNSAPKHPDAHRSETSPAGNNFYPIYLSIPMDANTLENPALFK
jgi:hypothetical protein